MKAREGVAPRPLASDLTALLSCFKKGTKGKKESKSLPEENIPKTKENTNPQTKQQNHQLKYTFTKDGEHGFPVYFLGDLVIQANMAKPSQNPKEQHTDEPNVRRGAVTFWVERNTGRFGAALLDTVGFQSTFSFPSCTHNLQ